MSAAKSVLHVRFVPTVRNSMFDIGAGYHTNRVFTRVSYTAGCNNLVSSEATVNGFLHVYRPKVPIKTRANQRIQIQKRSHEARGRSVNIAMSTPSETLRLLGVYRETNDHTIRATLVSNYEPLVRSLCREFSSSREPEEDLFQIGKIRLLNAIEKFDPERGSSFSSLAIPEIMGAILNYLRDHGNLLEIPRGPRSNKLAMDKVSDSISAIYGRKATQAEIAEACDLTETEITDASILSRIGDPRSLDESLETEDGDDGASLSDHIGFEDEGHNISWNRLTLATALGTLPEREKTILQLRYFHSRSQHQTTEIVSISQIDVSRLERAALNKLSLVLQLNPNFNSDQTPVRATRRRNLTRVS